MIKLFKKLNALKQNRQRQLYYEQCKMEESLKENFLDNIDKELLKEIEPYLLFTKLCVAIRLPKHLTVVWGSPNVITVSKTYTEKDTNWKSFDTFFFTNLADALIFAEENYYG